MDFVITNRNAKVTDRFQEYISEKVQKIETLGDKPERLEVKVTHEPNPRQSGSADRVELTVVGRGQSPRAEASSADLFSAFDLAYAKLLERMRRVRDRRKDHRRKGAPVEVSPQPELIPSGVSSLSVASADTTVEQEATVDNQPPVVIRRKVFKSTPISVEEAVDNMELVGHDFFLFHDEETGKPSVVYRRRGWSYGVISLDGQNGNTGQAANEAAEASVVLEEDELRYRVS